MKRARRLSIIAERLCFVLALLCLLPLGVTTAGRHYFAAGLDTAALDATAPIDLQIDTDTDDAPADVEPDTLRKSRWPPHRLEQFVRMRNVLAPTPIARLEFPKQRADVPVFSGDNEITMTLGAGHLRDTSPVDGSGNIVITSHRDGAFRLLRDIFEGDYIRVVTPARERNFRVEHRFVVSPDRVDLLQPSAETTLTLITCYPFYFVGNAPDRFIVQAKLVPVSESSGASVDLQP